MMGNGFESSVGRSANWDLIPIGPEEEMGVRIALRRASEENVRQRSDSICQEFIASAQMACGSGAWRVIAASPEAMRSV